MAAVSVLGWTASAAAVGADDRRKAGCQQQRATRRRGHGGEREAAEHARVRGHADEGVAEQQWAREEAEWRVPLSARPVIPSPASAA